jgi:hypothetical protein
VWGGAATLLLLPLVAMQFTREVDWSGSDFALMAIMLTVACGTVELGLRLSGSPAYRAGFAIAAVAGFLLVWVNLAVGMVGNEDDGYNAWFGAVLVTGLLGAIVARFRAPGMVRALLAAALVQAAVSGIAILRGDDPLGAMLSALWILFWLASARCFHLATDTTTSIAQQRLQVHALLASLAIVLGVLLLAAMVGVEGEPGLLPPVLVTAGVTWLVVTRLRGRRLAHRE